MKPIKGKIEDWSLMQGVSQKLVIDGRIFDHDEMPDGFRITTSQVQMITGGMVHTVNSRYYLGKMQGTK